MAWDEGQTLEGRFEHACQAASDLHRHWRVGTSYSGFTQALTQQLPTLTAALVKRFRRQLREQAGSHWRCHGWTAFAVDGTRQEAPHTAANEAELGCAGRAKTAPQVFLTTILHLGLGVPWDFRVGPGTSSEQKHLDEMLAELPGNALLIADAGFGSYGLCRRLLRSGRSFLLRIGANRRLLTKLGYWKQERDGTVYLWPENQRPSGRPLVLRLIRLIAKKTTVYLITNVLQPRQLSKATAEALYRRRWGEEVFFRSFKQTLSRRTLLSRTAATCGAESQVTLLALWLLGLMTTRAVSRRGVKPALWSVARARDAVRLAARDQRPRGARRPLLEQLAHAHHDDYVRRRRKQARNYPRKKRDPVCQPPKIEPATRPEIRRAQRLTPPDVPSKWAA